jgi:hypothetical protein
VVPRRLEVVVNTLVLTGGYPARSIDGMPGKTAQLQIRVTPEEKRILRRLADEASMDMSAWILDRVLPRSAERFQELVAALAEAGADDRTFGLAEVADFLRELPRAEFVRAVAHAPRARLEPGLLNHLAAAIELAAQRRKLKPPPWTAHIAPSDSPEFGSTLGSVRLHLLTSAPVALRRRNLFMDASFDDRV